MKTRAVNAFRTVPRFCDVSKNSVQFKANVDEVRSLCHEPEPMYIGVLHAVVTFGMARWS